MSQVSDPLPVAATEGFSLEQKQYLEGFFAGVTQRMPFAGHLPDGRLTNDASSGLPNAAAPSAETQEETFWGVPVGDLCAEEIWKFERNPLDCWDALLAHAAEDSSPDSEHRFRFKYFGLFHVAPAQDSFHAADEDPGRDADLEPDARTGVDL